MSGGYDLIVMMDADGSNAKSIHENAWDAAWSPDGKKFACTANTAKGFKVCVMDADLQHPPSRIPEMIAEVFLQTGFYGGNPAGVEALIMLVDAVDDLRERGTLVHEPTGPLPDGSIDPRDVVDTTRPAGE